MLLTALVWSGMMYAVFTTSGEIAELREKTPASAVRNEACSVQLE
jgi:hypothetical protein